MTPQARGIRRVIDHIDGAWVRVWRSGEIWAGAPTRHRAEIVKISLENAGYVASFDGKPATSGADILRVRL